MVEPLFVERRGKDFLCLTWKQCEFVSSYYQFPVAVFLLSEKNMKKFLRGKRENKLLDKIAKLEAGERG